MLFRILITSLCGVLALGLWLGFHGVDSGSSLEPRSGGIPLPAAVATADEPAVRHDCHHADCVAHEPSAALPRRGRARPAPMEVAWLDQAERADVGERVEARLGLDVEAAGEVMDRTDHPDGRVSVGIRLDDGGSLFLVFHGEDWRGRLTYGDRREAWLLSGDADGGAIRQLDVTDVICSRVVDGKPVAGLPPNENAGPAVAEAQAPEVAEAVPLLNSLPDANGVIYLDFDGEVVSGTNWNSSFTGGEPINAGSSNYTAAQITRVWEGIAEDYRPFNITVTTSWAEYTRVDEFGNRVYPTNRRTMVIFTPTYQWYGDAGGVAYVDVFGSSFYDEPAWVFTPFVGDEAGAAEAGAHEAGHTLGLRHDGNPTDGEYYLGHGSGATSWCPIMGGSYYSTVTQWSKGEYTGATNTEDDLAIIAGTRNGLGYRPDDHSDSTSGATAVNLPGGDVIEASGVIERTGDVDVFVVQAAAGEIMVEVMNDPTDPNLDIRLRLLDGTGAPVEVWDDPAYLDAAVSATVPAGTYFIEVDGVGTGDPDTGYTDYASLGAYSISGTAPQSSQLSAEIMSPATAGVSLPFGTGVLLEGSATGGTFGWEVTQAPGGGSAVFSAPGSLSTRCDFDAPGLYQVRLLADNGSETAEDALFVSVEADGDPKVYANRGPAVDLGPDRGIYGTDAVLHPSIADDGVPAPPELEYSWTILSGAGSLSDDTIANPILSFGAAGPVGLRLVVFDGEIRSFDEVLLDGRFSSKMLVGGDPLSDPGSTLQGWALVPTDGSLDGLWRAPGFDDSGWQTGQLGVGYDATPGNAAKRLFRPLIGDGLDVQATMHEEQSTCYLRVPFNLASAASVLRLDLRMQYDDGFVAYLNGLEVARGNAPAGTPAWDSLAASDRADEAALSFETYSLDLAPGVLLDGANVLAVHGLNSAIAGGPVKEPGFVIVPELEAMIALLPFDGTVAVIDDPEQRKAGDNPDGDDWVNLYEHAFGGDPEQADSMPVMLIDSDPKLTILLPDNPPDDVLYEVERCTSLSEPWVVVASKAGPADWSGEPPDGSTAAGGGRSWLVFAPDAATRVFYRLRVSLVTP